MYVATYVNLYALGERAVEAITNIDRKGEINATIGSKPLRYSFASMGARSRLCRTVKNLFKFYHRARFMFVIYNVRYFIYIHVPYPVVIQI